MYTAPLMYYRERSVRTYKDKTYIREYWTAESSFYDKNGTKQRVRGRGATRAEATKRLNKNLRQRIDGTRTAMSILGHSSEAMTLYYTIINADQQRKALEGLSNVYEHHNVYNADYEAEGNGTLTKLRSDSIR